GVVAVETSGPKVRYLVWLHGLRGPPTRIVDGDPRAGPDAAYAVGGHRFALSVAGGVEIVDLDSGRVSRIAGEVGAANALALSPDGSTLVLATPTHSAVYVVRVSDGTVENTFVGHQSQVHGVTFNTSGSVVFTAGADGRLIAWDLAGTHGLAVVRPLAGPTVPQDPSLPAGRLFAASARARLVAAVLGDGTVRLLAGTAPAMQQVRSIAVPKPSAVALDAAGSTVAVGTDDGKVLVFAAATGKQVAT
ncbi:MAG TPA: hypothetical protein VKT18_02930, partial [Acidimicrobiales bacterium]|nr:hypothetical protein [Acidimicrobiales bacterium]